MKTEEGKEAKGKEKKNDLEMTGEVDQKQEIERVRER